MKKHDEGYVLAFVMVVVAVLSLISLAVSTLAVRNIETQQAAVERMQAKYKVEGEVEIASAQLYNISKISVPNGEDALTEEQKKEAALGNALTQIYTNLSECSYVSGGNDKFTYTFKYTTNETNIPIISGIIELTGTIKKESEGEEYTVSIDMVKYLSYEISSTPNELSEGGATQ